MMVETKKGAHAELQDNNASIDAIDPTISATICATGAVTRSTDVHIYGVGIIVMLTIGLFVCFKKRSSQASSKEQVKEQLIKQSPRKSMLQN